MQSDFEKPTASWYGEFERISKFYLFSGYKGLNISNLSGYSTFYYPT